jgi:hypothetical protein
MRGAVISDSMGTARRMTFTDRRRVLQLALAAIWLLDAVMQFQPRMFGPDFARETLASAARGNPAPVARPITWSADMVAGHPAGPNTVFGLVELAIAVGIAWRSTVRIALGASAGWALAVWWLREGFGGLLTGRAGPLTGAPGAALLYALLAVVLWPVPREGASVAEEPLGVRRVRAIWLVLWAGIGDLALLPANRAPQAPHRWFAELAEGQPSWLGWLDGRAAGLTGHRGLAFSVVVAVVLMAVGAGIYLPRRLVRWTLVVAVAAALVLWVIGQNLGAPFDGRATDPGTAPLLALFAVAFWPLGPVTPAGSPVCAEAEAVRS